MQDIDFELSEGIGLGEPILASVDPGTATLATVVPRTDGRLTLGAQLLEQVVAPPSFPRVPFPSLHRPYSEVLVALATEVETPECYRREVVEVTTLTPGAWTVLSLDSADITLRQASPQIKPASPSSASNNRVPCQARFSNFAA